MSTEETPPPDAADTGQADQERPPSFGLADALRKGLADYLDASQAHPAEGKEVVVDLAFLERHAGPLLAHLLRSATRAMLAKDVRLSVSAPPRPDAPEGPQVRIDVDLGDLLSKLFDPAKKVPPQ